MIPTWEPLGFTIEPHVEEDFDGNFEWTPRATSARAGSARLYPFQHLSQTNLDYQHADGEVLSLNSNDGALFQFQQLKREPIWVVHDRLQGPWKHAVAAEPVHNVGFAASKHTDLLLLRLQHGHPDLDLEPAGDNRLYVRAAYYSWGYLLRKAACDDLDVEPAELAVNIRPVTTDDGAVCEVLLFDSLENGAGYCQHLSQRLYDILLKPLLPSGWLHKRLHDAFHMQGRDAQGCDSACYDCLRDYNNAELHAILDWRLGLDLALLAADAGARVDLNALHWRLLAEKVARSLARVFGAAEAVQLEGHWVIRTRRRLCAVLTHPLWTPSHPDLIALAKRLGVERTALPCCTLFDALRRPGWYLSQQGRKQASR